MSDLANNFRKVLQDIFLEDYFQENLPCHYDQQILSFVNTIVESDVKTQKCLEPLLSLDDTSKLLMFSKRMASLAIRESSIRVVKSSFYALSYCFKIEDHRDLLVRICLLYHSILRLKYSPCSVINDMRFYDSNFKKFIEDFFRRDAADKSLEAFKYFESKDQDGFLYKKIISEL